MEADNAGVSERPLFDPGDVVCSSDGDFSFKVIEHIGEGRCCLVYAARSIRDGTKVALKVFKRGPNYDGAVQREQYILETLNDPANKIVTCYGYFIFKGLHCLVMELLVYNIRQLIFRNDRQGLSPWLTQKFARDLLTSLAVLHDNCFVHADLKPANVMWSSCDGCFKLLDFGLTFHTDESDLHQIQSSGYKAPEAADWNKYKEEEKRQRKRKLQGTYTDLSTDIATPAYCQGLNDLGDSRSSSLGNSCHSAPVSNNGRSQLPPPPRRRRHHRLSCVFPPAPQIDDETYVQRRSLHENDKIDSLDDTVTPKAEEVWPSESSGIYTASSSHCPTPSTRSVDVNVIRVRQQQNEHIASELGEISVSIHDSVFRSSLEPSLSSSLTSASHGSNSKSCTPSQEWRRGRKPRKINSDSKRCPPPRRPLSTCAAAKFEDWERKRRPFVPNEAVDVWAFGCLLVEALTGRKMFRVDDKMASVLKPLQLLEMRIGETEIRYDDDSDRQHFFSDAKSLIQRCLVEDPRERISVRAALGHAFFTDHEQLLPSVKDMVLLPTNIMRLLNVLGDDSKSAANNDDVLEVLQELREEAEKYGKVTEVRAQGGHAYLEFQEASDCERACVNLSGRTFEDRTVVAVFYPTQLWINKVFI